MNHQKLQRWLAQQGLSTSRRKAESLIASGRVVVNGVCAHLGQRVGESDIIKLDGRIIDAQPVQPLRVLAYHKPVGIVSTRNDPEQRAIVFDDLPLIDSGRWVMVGRLDIQTSGLLLFTNEGRLAHQLMHPSQALTRRYRVRVPQTLTPHMQHKLCEGIKLSDGWASFDRILKAPSSSGRNQWYEVTLHQGRNRIVRRLFEAIDCPVNRLVRLSFGPIHLPRTLKSGEYRLLDEVQLKQLNAAIIASRNTS
ncbi:MAG: 23S rRNA pseudouridylate synthase B [Legionellales bacterium]|nr:23S rRNA pseudouridylate synthase B [Legionellales bacterium]